MKPNSINFELLQIKTDQFVIFEENFNKKNKVNLNTNLIFGLNSDDKIFSITPKYTFESNSKPFISIQVSCYFKVEDEAWQSFIKENKIIFPKGFIAHMSMITVGTSRGVLHTKTENTIFNEFILPTLNVSKMVSEDVEFDL